MMVYTHCCEIQVTKAASLIQPASMVEIKFTEFMRITDLQLATKILHSSSFTNLKKLNLLNCMFFFRNIFKVYIACDKECTMATHMPNPLSLYYT